MASSSGSSAWFDAQNEPLLRGARSLIPLKTYGIRQVGSRFRPEPVTMVHEDRLCKGKLVLILRRRPRSRKECFSFQGACIPRGLFLRKDPGVGRAPAQ